jgi:putative sterol carrier protein
MSQDFSSVQDYFDTLGARFQPDAAKGVDAVIQWDITGDAGGQWFATVKEQILDLNTGNHEKPNVTLHIDDENWVKLINGQAKGAMLVMKRKMKVKGNILLARKMEKMFPLK